MVASGVRGGCSARPTSHVTAEQRPSSTAPAWLLLQAQREAERVGARPCVGTKPLPFPRNLKKEISKKAYSNSHVNTPERGPKGLQDRYWLVVSSAPVSTKACASARLVWRESQKPKNNLHKIRLSIIKLVSTHLCRKRPAPARAWSGASRRSCATHAAACVRSAGASSGTAWLPGAAGSPRRSTAGGSQGDDLASR